MKRFLFIVTVLIVGFGAHDALASSPAQNQRIPTHSSDVSFTRLPYYHSSEWGSLLLTEDNLLIHYSNIGLMTYDYGAESAIWQRFFGYEDVPPMALEYAVGSVGVDPLDSDVIYFCSGNLSFTTEDSADYHLSAYQAAVYRSVDGLASAGLILGQDNQPDFYEYACESWGYARFIIDTADNGTEIEGWKIMARNELFAFDDTSTVTIDGKTMSDTIYYLTYQYGLKRLTIDASGGMTTETVHKEPLTYDADDSGLGSAYSGWDPSYDSRYYQYLQSGAAYDELLHYPYQTASDGTKDCDYVYDDGVNGAQEVHGDYDAAAHECVEDEEIALGTDVEMDTVALASGTTVLFTGYMSNQVFTHGGLFRGVEGADGNFTWTEITHPTTGEHLDVRDIELDTTRTVRMSSTRNDASLGLLTEAVKNTSPLTTGLTVTSTFYVAAGRHGMFKGVVSRNGSVTLTEINTGFYTREEMLADYPSYSSDCADTSSCGQALSIDQAYVDGRSYLLLSHSGGNKFAIDDFSRPVAWYEIDSNATQGATRDGALSDSEETLWDAYGNWGGFTEAGLIDPVNKQFLLAVDSLIYKVDISSLTMDVSDYSANGASWHAFHEGFGDRAGFEIVYDPQNPDKRVHFTVIDSGYNSVEWDSDMKLVEDDFDARTIDKGICYKLYHVDAISDVASHYEGTDTNSVDDSYLESLDNPRNFYYGSQMLSIGSGKSATMYLTATHNDSHYNYGIMRADWDSGDGRWEWTPATGESTCVAKYPEWNNIQNSCVLICETPTIATTSTRGALPEGSIDLAVDPADADHLYAVVLTEAGSKYFYESANGGASWLDKSSTYYAGSTSLGTLGEPEKLVVDPSDPDIVYAAYPSAGVYMRNASGTSFTDITALDPDDSVQSDDLAYVGTAYPTITDLAAVNESGKTRLYLTARAACDAGWGVYPKRSTSTSETPCGQIDHGGIYTRLVGTDTKWRKLNKNGTETDFFSANQIAISPANPDHIAIAGVQDDINLSGGGLQDVIAGVIYTTDKGVTWNKMTSAAISARSISAHPTDEDKFVVSLEANGIWELDLSNPDTDGDGIPDANDDCTVTTADPDCDGLTTIDPNPSKSNTWYWVNSATGTVLNTGDAADGKSYTYVGGIYMAGKIIVSGVSDRTKAFAGAVFKDCTGSASSSGSGTSSLGTKIQPSQSAPAVIASGSRPTSQTAPVTSSTKTLGAISLTSGVSGVVNGVRSVGVTTIKKVEIGQVVNSGTYGICILNEETVTPTKAGSVLTGSGGIMKTK